MSKIFELFGYRLDAWGPDAASNCMEARCPFMDAECDGGGNRYLSAINLRLRSDLQKFFPTKTTVQAGVCSLRLRENEQPWIVCPRRLLSLKDGVSRHQTSVHDHLIRYSGLSKGTRVRVWSEVKMKLATQTEDDETKSFDYTFDYVLAGSERRLLSDVAVLMQKSVRAVKKLAAENGFTVASRNGEEWIENFPSDPITIVEVMTSSTSGGNKENRTQIAMAFEDAVTKGLDHQGPTINYRQVWARMVSQLIVKSQVGLAWGGKTMWVLQDVLADYISSTTSLDLSRYLATKLDEVNILAFGYGQKATSAAATDDIASLEEAKLYAGPISKSPSDGGFIEIVKIGAAPPKDALWKSLFKKKSSGSLTV
ncbi:MAG: hypothetical protein EBQ89_00660 [Alphaproteobacteria bacterium]|nr:hypothetical protein [Alphaproteobacteria bacterium]